jgi:hypothetical protein
MERSVRFGGRHGAAALGGLEVRRPIETDRDDLAIFIEGSTDEVRKFPILFDQKVTHGRLFLGAVTKPQRCAKTSRTP